VLGAALALAGWTSCTGRAPAPEAEACAPVQGELATGSRADALAGEFRLSLTATHGPRAGSTAAGTLRLRPFGDRPPPVPAAERVRYPLYGATDLAPASVGAAAPGDVGSDDPAGPGVLAIEWERSGAQAITLRLGADANQGDRLRFDGASLALFVTSITPGRFAGRWESGGEQRAGGYFCAERVG
jgi:hypothetical protein